MSLRAPLQSDAAIAAHALDTLTAVVAIDSASDEDSPTIPSTQGQAILARDVAARFEALGATTEQDAHANVIATLPGRGAGAHAPPLALMVHLDTAKGTAPLSALAVTPSWDGSALHWSGNPRIQVDVATYPALARYVGQDVVRGDGRAPFGLDDKLGLTHMLSLAWLLSTNPEVPHPPLLFIGRPDEEIGRMEALLGLAALLADRGVALGYTVDGLDPFEINVENFNAAGAGVVFPARPIAVGDDLLVAVSLTGVNTHGATAHAEGHRAATRLAALVQARLAAQGDTRIVGFRSDPLRDCDAVVVFAVAPSAEGALSDTLDAVVQDHRARGAGWERVALQAGFVADGAAGDMLRFVSRFLDSAPGLTLLAEESHGRDGYSHPWRAFPVEGGVRLDIRIRDFSEEGLARRIAHVKELGGTAATVTHQYVNMGPRLTDRPELVQWATEAASAVGVRAPVQPIRGGTGVDPFLDVGVAVGNLGTGYFAPESEKELTTAQMMAAHARWLLALVQIAARA